MTTETIKVTVTGTPPNGTYSSSSRNVRSDGKIRVNPGSTNIVFVPGRGQGWSFEKPWITIEPHGGPFEIEETSPRKIKIRDSDPKGPPDQKFNYTLHTTQRDFDPAIINKGGSG